jgi:hypothetical protein
MTPLLQPANERVLRYLTRHGALVEERAPREGQRDYWEAGSHPDVVERIWDKLANELPVESRRVVCGSPAVVHPVSKVVLALAIGTQYAIRLPSDVVTAGVPARWRTDTTWAGGQRLDVREEFGDEWVFGNYSTDEVAWCRACFDQYS